MYKCIDIPNRLGDQHSLHHSPEVLLPFLKTKAMKMPKTSVWKAQGALYAMSGQLDACDPSAGAESTGSGVETASQLGS